MHEASLNTSSITSLTLTVCLGFAGAAKSKEKRSIKLLTGGSVDLLRPSFSGSSICYESLSLGAELLRASLFMSLRKLLTVGACRFGTV